MNDYEFICEISKKSGEEAIEHMTNIETSSNKSNIYKSTFSATNIVQECKNIDTANQLSFFLKNMNILSRDGKLSQFSYDNNFGIIFKGRNKKGEDYSQIRYTQKGKNFILKNLYNSNPTVKINAVEIRYIYKNNDLDNMIDNYVIIAFIEENENVIYQLKQKIVDHNKAKNLIDKIEKKRFINLKYWTCKTLDDLSNDELIYFSDEDIYLDYDRNFNDDYYDESENGETQRMIEDVSRQLGYDVDEDLARSFLHDISRN